MVTKLKTTRSRIHISYDLWTSPNSLAILGIIAHFVDINSNLQAVTLVLKDIIGDYIGEHLVTAILEVLGDNNWQLLRNLGYFTIDNALNNDTMMRAIQRGNISILIDLYTDFYRALEA